VGLRNRRRQVKIIPTQIAGFADAQAMPVDQEADQPIAVPVAVAPERGQQLGDLGFGQVLAGAVFAVPFSVTGRFLNDSGIRQAYDLCGYL
jgi:hypothetical protein